MVKKKNKYKIFVIFLTLVFVFQFLICGIKTNTNTYAEYVYTRPNTAIPFTLKQDSNGNYLIESLTDLNSFAQSVNSGEDTRDKTFLVKSRIKLDSSFEGIGTDYPFMGNFDGGGVFNAIENINRALFVYTFNANISNIEVASGELKYSNGFVSAFVEKAENTKIYRCINRASVLNTYNEDSGCSYTGGIVGYAINSSIVECSNFGNITNNGNKLQESFVGGIMGYADENSLILNCYVSGFNNEITIKAEAKSNDTTTTIRAVNDSVYYSQFETVNQEAQNDLQKLKEDMYSKGNELSEVDRKIQEKNNDISYYQSKINALKKWQVASRAWYEGRKLEKEAEILALKATRKIKSAAYDAAKWLVDTFWNSVSYLNKDVQWLNAQKNCTKTVKIKNAYAYGIGYSNGNVTNCYTANVACVGGYEKINYNFYYRLWASTNGVAIGFSDDIYRKVNFENVDKFGAITNNNANNCFYLNDFYYTRKIAVQYEAPRNYDINGNLYNRNTSDIAYYNIGDKVFGHKIIFECKDNVVSIFADNQKGNAKTIIDSCYFSNTPTATIIGTSCRGNKSSLTSNIKYNFDSSIWAVDESIENGYPHLKFRYWQDHS